MLEIKNRMKKVKNKIKRGVTVRYFEGVFVNFGVNFWWVFVSFNKNLKEN